MFIGIMQYDFTHFQIYVTVRSTFLFENDLAKCVKKFQEKIQEPLNFWASHVWKSDQTSPLHKIFYNL